MIIECTHLQKRFGSHIVIQDFSYTFDHPGLYAITGKSGSGKTTLLNMIGGLEKCSKGSVKVDGQVLKTARQKRFYYQKVAFLFQNYALLNHLSVEKNLSEMTSSTEQERDTVLEKLHITETLHQKVHELSGGQQQRVALARAILHGGDVLLCDEPTANLDEENKEEIFQLIQGLSQDRIVIIVTHDLSLASRCDHQIRL